MSGQKTNLFGHLIRDGRLMKIKRRVKVKKIIFVGLIVFLVAGFGLSCSASYYPDRTVTANVLTITEPLVCCNTTMVMIFWEEPQHPTTGGGRLEVGEAASYQIWYAFPIDKVPQELLGKYVNKEASITYHLVEDDKDPVIQIISFHCE